MYLLHLYVVTVGCSEGVGECNIIFYTFITHVWCRKLNYNTRIDDWNAQVAQKIGDILDNHVLKIYLRDITANEDEKTEGKL